MGIYNWQQKDWPLFTYSLERARDDMELFAEKAGRVTGILEAMPEEARLATIIDVVLTEATKTSEIEGEYPNRQDVLSSIRKNLGLHDHPKHIRDRSAAGLGELLIDVRNTYAEPLTENNSQSRRQITKLELLLALSLMDKETADLRY